MKNFATGNRSRRGICLCAFGRIFAQGYEYKTGGGVAIEGRG